MEMKTKIKTWIESYFYFNRLEQQGIYLLLFFILLTWLIKLWVPVFFKPKPIEVNLTMAEIPTTTYKDFEKSNFNTFYADSTKKKPEPKPKLAIVDLNQADSLEILSLYRVGPALTSKILQYRKKLGGFVSLQQLTEIYGFNEDLLYDLDGKITISSKSVVKFNLNSVSFDDLKSHPYFKFVLSKQIVNYRQVHGQFKEIYDLKNIKTVNDSILNLIKPYVFVD